MKMSVNLSDADVATIRQIAAEREISFTQALRDAIATERFIRQAIADGERILVEKGGKRREIVFR